MYITHTIEEYIQHHLIFMEFEQRKNHFQIVRNSNTQMSKSITS